MQTTRFLTLPELLVVIRAWHGAPIPAMAARCGLDPDLYAAIEAGQAPSRESFDTLIERLPALGTILLGRKTPLDEGLHQVIDVLHTVTPDDQAIAIARLKLELQWQAEAHAATPPTRPPQSRRCRRRHRGSGRH